MSEDVGGAPQFPVDCRIVGYDEFVRLPPGTVFAMWEPCIVKETMIKGDTLYDDVGTAIDFVEAPLTAGTYIGKDGPAYDRVVVDDAGGRWGYFETDAQFVVYPPEAVRAMIHLLMVALATSQTEEPGTGDLTTQPPEQKP